MSSERKNVLCGDPFAAAAQLNGSDRGQLIAVALLQFIDGPFSGADSLNRQAVRVLLDASAVSPSTVRDLLSQFVR